MEITRTEAPDRVELKLKGRLDAVWSDHVANALTECVRAGHHFIALDLTEVDYISSAGIRILLLHSRQLKAIQGCLAIPKASDAVRTVLKLVGLDTLLHVGEDAKSIIAAAPGENPIQEITFAQTGATAQIFELAPGSTFRVQWQGDSAEWIAGRAKEADWKRIEFAADMIGLGLGGFSSGSESEEGGGLGEFLAAGGAAICQPADGCNKPDYMLLEGALTPVVNVAYGILGRGGFSHLIRFDKGSDQPGLPLSAVVNAGLNAVNCDAAGIVILAETGSLVGASLQRSPVQKGQAERGDMFSFPEVRDWLSFTAEAGFANSVSLIVGFAARGSFPLLKPLLPSGELHGHFHAAAFPYHPLRKGKVSLSEAMRPIFESENVLGVLHLLNDWRDAAGSGESSLLRGACWCAPLVK